MRRTVGVSVVAVVNSQLQLTVLILLLPPLFS